MLSLFSEVKNPDIKEAYIIIYEKYMNSKDEKERRHYWKQYNKVMEWEMKDRGIRV